MKTVKSFKEFIRESVWSDIQDRNAGEVARKEDKFYIPKSKGELVEYISNKVSSMKDHTLDLKDIDLSELTSINSLFEAVIHKVGVQKMFKIETIDVTGWGTYTIKDMAYTFRLGDSWPYLERIIGLDTWDVSGVRDMDSMFAYIPGLKQADVENWNVGNVKNMKDMFRTCDIEKLDLNNWDVSNVENMESMFESCTAEELIISKWNVGRVRNMSNMFKLCANIEELDVSKWNVSNVKDMSSMFYQCYFTKLDVENWDVRNVKDMSNMFAFCSHLKDLNLKNWNVDSLENMNHMFRQAGIKYKKKDNKLIK